MVRPKRIQKKRLRSKKVNWDLLEVLDWIGDIKRRERLAKGPNPEAKKLLDKKDK